MNDALSSDALKNLAGFMIGLAILNPCIGAVLCRGTPGTTGNDPRAFKQVKVNPVTPLCRR